ncbi:MAG: peroxiredoxin [Holosporaceae bacterium]|jgi:peroxiredoxin (alkyl hydroperoxide reductase subunit C)|nr:peroxiredoxin [Holosporaceae bacterium]
MLTVGDKFPSFNLVASSDLPFEQLNMDNAFKSISESTYSGKWKLVFFYPKDFTFVCPTEIIAFANLHDEFRQRNAQILGCSVDSEFVHWAWRKHHPELRNLPFPLMADVKRELSSELGVLCKNSGVAQRALFIVDPDDVIRFVMVTDSSVGRNPAEVLRVLDALQTGELCQCGWIRGSKTLDPRAAFI